MVCAVSLIATAPQNGCKARKPVATLKSGCTYSVEASYNSSYDRNQSNSYGSTTSNDISCKEHQIGRPGGGHFTSSTYGEIQESERQSHDDCVDYWYIAAFRCSEVRPFFAPRQAEANKLIADLRELQHDLQARAGGHTSIESSVVFCKSINVPYSGRFNATTRVCARCQPERRVSQETRTQFREVSRILNITDRLACSPYAVVKSQKYPSAAGIACEGHAMVITAPKAAGPPATTTRVSIGPSATRAHQRKDESSSSVADPGQVELGCATSDRRSNAASACAPQLPYISHRALSRKASMHVSSRLSTCETNPAHYTSPSYRRKSPRLFPSEIVLPWTMMPGANARACAGAVPQPQGRALLSITEAAKLPKTATKAQLEAGSMTGSSTEASDGGSGGSSTIVDGDMRELSRGLRPGTEGKATQSPAESREFVIRPLFLLRTQGPMWRFLLLHAQFVRTLSRKVGVPQLAVVRLAEVETAGTE